MAQHSIHGPSLEECRQFTMVADRWSGAEEFVWELAVATGVRIKLLARKGWLRQHFLYELQGEPSAFQQFEWRLQEAMVQYNQRLAKV